MATLTVWKFAGPDGADQALATLEGLQKQALIEVLDGAVVSWPPDKKKPKTRQLDSTTRAGALGGAFWGLLFGPAVLVVPGPGDRPVMPVHRCRVPSARHCGMP